MKNSKKYRNDIFYSLKNEFNHELIILYTQEGFVKVVSC